MKRRLLVLALSILLVIPVYATESEEGTEESLVPAMSCFVGHEESETLQTQIEEQKARMEAAHAMANAARQLGLAEESETIQLAKIHWNEANTQFLVFSEQLATFSPMIELSFVVFQKTNLTVDALNIILAGSALEGAGEDFYAMEQDFGVNALFAMAVAKTESGLGTSNYAKNRNNYFGMIGRTFASQAEGIAAFGDLMTRRLYTGKTMDEIAAVYCPLNASLWVEKNQSYMNNFWEKLCTQTQAA